jgi:hypothetical protein
VQLEFLAKGFAVFLGQDLSALVGGEEFFGTTAEDLIGVKVKLAQLGWVRWGLLGHFECGRTIVASVALTGFSDTLRLRGA